MYESRFMRARVYVDGFNFYYRALKGTQFKWLNPMSLSVRILDDGDRIERIRYFTADVSPRAGDQDAPRRQATYFRALKTIPELEIHKGNFLAKKITRPLVDDPSKFVRVHDTEEKGSDVNLATHLLMDAFNDSYDVALVLSQDTDLLEPIKMVTQEFQKTVVVGWFDRTQPGRRHREVASSIRRIRSSVLRASQFPETIVTKGGAHVRRPAAWCE